MASPFLAPSVGSWSGTPSSLTKVNTADQGKPPEHSRPCDPRRYRALYPHLWQAFLRAHFQDATHVAFFFGVDPKSARDWWEGVTGANGASAVFAVATTKGALEFISNEVRKAG